MKSNDHRGRFKRGATWSFISSFFSQGLVILTALMISRQLGHSLYGGLILIQTTLAALTVYASTGISTTAIRAIAVNKKSDELNESLSAFLCINLAISVIFTFIIFNYSAYISHNIFRNKNLHIPLMISSLSILFISLDFYFRSIVIGFEQMKIYAKTTIISAIFTSMLLVVGSIFWGINGASTSIVLGSFVQASISFYFSNKILTENGLKIKLRISSKSTKILRDFTLPAALGGALFQPTIWICQTMLARTDDGLAQVAILGISMQWFNAIMFLPTVTARILVPILSDLHSLKNQIASHEILKMSFAVNGIFSIFLVIAVTLFARDILLLYGEEYSGYGRVLTVVSIAAALLAMQTPAGNIVVAASKMWTGFFMNAAWALVYITSSYFLVEGGAIGIAWALLISYILHATWTMAFAYKELKLHPR